ncbi:VanW family protein [Eubacterium sp. MSJ-13]|uniref:VanW family protein n=1 Tax=Eubacterium sp. MSJ-13 TaxID=2841513 RepID=UPI001C10E3E8|nr:VanW family protein [Eubacterium sp. MSJ-13]MBU5477844.1 VanW family protein [Eubacterium sp. MSJ-13]
MTKNNKKTGIIILEACLCILFICLIIAAVVKAKILDNKLIAQGANISGVDIGGLTKEQAEKKIDKYTSYLKNREITIRYGNGEKDTKATFEKLGFYIEDNDYVQAAYNIGKTGNIFKRFKELISVNKKDVTYNLKTGVDKDVLKNYITLKGRLHNKKVINSKLKIVKGKLKATKDQTGIKVDIADTTDAFYKEISGNLKDKSLTLDAVVKVKKPKYTKKMYSKCTDLLGEYSTDYSSSTSDRCNNVQTAAGRINGTILYPGQTFSTVKVIKDRTEANGYKAAPEYSGGRVVAGVGGGVCQVSTTLYNAVINAELEVVERSPHSMVVHYVNVSRDAAISGNYKDLKFKNNTKSPIYIAASANGGILSFKIFGEETRSKKRKIAFESEIVEEKQPEGEVVTVDTTKPSGYREITQSAHTGYSARLWKIIYINGVEKKRVLVNTSSYNAEPQHVTVGRQEVRTEENKKSYENKSDTGKTDTKNSQ